MIKLDGFEKIIVAVGLLLAVFSWFGPQVFFDTQAKNPANSNLPYNVELVSSFPKKEPATNSWLGFACALVDYQGNGFPEFVIFASPGISAIGYSGGKFHNMGWAFNFETKFTWEERSMAVFGGMDVNGNGREEVLVAGRTEDGLEYVFIAYDPVENIQIGKIVLPVGEDRRKDGFWDGSYWPIATFEYPGEDGLPNRALLISCDVKYDGVGRGVYALDFLSNKVVWSYQLGPNPTRRNVSVVDLENDGKMEIIISTSSPGNLKNEIINGSSDDESWIYVLDVSGELLWSKRLGLESCATFHCEEDLNNDGILELISVTSSNRGLSSKISVWNTQTGEEESNFEIQDSIRWIKAGVDVGKGIPHVTLGTRNEGIQYYEIVNMELVYSKRIFQGKTYKIPDFKDFLPEPGLEILVEIDNKYFVILSSGLKILGSKKIEPNSHFWMVDIWSLESDLSIIMSSAGNLKVTSSTWANRIDLRQARLSGGLVLLMGVFFYSRRRWKSNNKTTLEVNDPVVLRELNLRLLGDLELSGHGALGVLKSLHRLIWHLDSICMGLGGSVESHKRNKMILHDFNESVLPHMRDILGLAEKADVDQRSVHKTGKALDEIETILFRIESSNFSQDVIEADLYDLKERCMGAEESLQKIRRIVENLFKSDINKILSLVIRACHEDLDSSNVKLILKGSERQVECRVDPSQLQFMLDNLVGNAIRSMRDSIEPTLEISLKVNDGFAICDITDSGCGIAKEDWNRVIETPFSKRKGGGLGLFETGRILRLYGGGISIKDSVPNKGTTFRMVVPVVRSIG